MQCNTNYTGENYNYNYINLNVLKTFKEVKNKYIFLMIYGNTTVLVQ